MQHGDWMTLSRPKILSIYSFVVGVVLIYLAPISLTSDLYRHLLFNCFLLLFCLFPLLLQVIPRLTLKSTIPCPVKSIKQRSHVGNRLPQFRRNCVFSPTRQTVPGASSFLGQLQGESKLWRLSSIYDRPKPLLLIYDRAQANLTERLVDTQAYPLVRSSL